MTVNPYRRGMPENLMGLTEVAAFLKVSRQRAHELSKKEGFPEPVAKLSAGLIWEAADIERWARETGRLT